MNKEYLFFELAKGCEKELTEMGFRLALDSSYKDKICIKAIDDSAGWNPDVVLEAFESFVEVAGFIRGWHKRHAQTLSEQYLTKKGKK